MTKRTAPIALATVLAFSLFRSLAGVVAAGAPPAYPPTEGDASFRRGDFGPAERAYRTTLARDPKSASAELGLARIALYRNDLDEAQRRVRLFARDEPADPRARRMRDAIALRRDDGPGYRASMKSGEADVPLVTIDPLPELDGVVDGKRARFVLDTGAPGLTLSASFARSLGLATASAGTAVIAGGAPVPLRRASVARLDLGAASVRSLTADVVDAMPFGVDGVVGTNVLDRFLTTIDYPRGRLVLRPKSASAGFEASLPSTAAAVPMFFAPDHFLFVRARAGRGPEALFNVDTGGSGVGVELTAAALAAAGIVPDASHARTFRSGAGDTKAEPFETGITLGGHRYAAIPGIYLVDGDRYGIFPFAVAGTISQELFKRGSLTFDFTAMRLVFDATPRASNRAAAP